MGTFCLLVFHYKPAIWSQAERISFRKIVSEIHANYHIPTNIYKNFIIQFFSEEIHSPVKSWLYVIPTEQRTALPSATNTLLAERPWIRPDFLWNNHYSLQIPLCPSYPQDVTEIFWCYDESYLNCMTKLSSKKPISYTVYTSLTYVTDFM